MTADAPRLPFNVREGVKRLLIVAAIASVCSIGATTWAWLEIERADRAMMASLEHYDAARLSKDDAAESVAIDIAADYARALEKNRARFISLRKWTAISHLVAAVAGLALWVLSGFVARQKAPLTTAADPHRLTGSADTGPPADIEG